MPDIQHLRESLYEVSRALQKEPEGPRKQYLYDAMKALHRAVNYNKPT